METSDRGTNGWAGAGGEVSRRGPNWRRRASRIGMLAVLFVAVGLAARALSQRYGAAVSVPGIYVKVRPERGGTVEARSTDLGSGGRRTADGGRPVSIEATLADAGSLVRLVAEGSGVRVEVPCPLGPRRVSLRAQEAPIEDVLQAIAAVTNLTLARRDQTYVLNACPRTQD